MFKCVLQYFDPFCSNPSEKFISKHISNIIGYTYLQPDITTPPPTYDIRVTSLEFCVHLMNFYVGVKLFVLHNDIIHRSCNIGTAAHLLFTKATSSDFQEFLGKVLSPLEFRLIVVLVWNEWFFFMHTLWFCNRNTLLLFFYDYILLNPSPIIWLLHLCHLCCINSDFLFSLMVSSPLSMLHSVGILVKIHAIRRLPMSLFGWILEGHFPDPYIVRRFYWQ